MHSKLTIINDSVSTSGRRESLDMAIDFEVTDALEKLRRMGILSEDCDDEDCKVLKVLPLDQAVDAAHINKFDETR